MEKKFVIKTSILNEPYMFNRRISTLKICFGFLRFIRHFPSMTRKLNLSYEFKDNVFFSTDINLIDSISKVFLMKINSILMTKNITQGKEHLYF